jgi:hypothetical protein
MYDFLTFLLTGKPWVPKQVQGGFLPVLSSFSALVARRPRGWHMHCDGQHSPTADPPLSLRG